MADYYELNRVEQRVFNSNGVNCLQKNMVPDCSCQLDLYHRNTAIYMAVNDGELRDLILWLLNKRQVQKALVVVDASIESILDEAEQEKRRKLLEYLSNHKGKLLPYY